MDLKLKLLFFLVVMVFSLKNVISFQTLNTTKNLQYYKLRITNASKNYFHKEVDVKQVKNAQKDIFYGEKGIFNLLGQGKNRAKRSLRFRLPSTRSWLAPSVFNYFLRNICSASASPCPKWSDWEGQDTCSSSCGGGTRVLERHCKNRRKLWNCRGPRTMVEECNTQECPGWGQWAPITKCSRACGEGQMILERKCLLGSGEVNGCDGVKTRIVPCVQREKCPPRWNAWSSFGPCKAPCEGDGVQERNRTCFDDNKKLVQGCRGPSKQLKYCVSKVRCSAKYSSWTTWEDCNLPSQMWSQKQRTRRCLHPPCKQEQLVDTVPCKANHFNLTKIPVSEQIVDEEENAFSDEPTWMWSQWSACTTSCGEKGSQYRARNCMFLEGGNSTYPLCDQRFTEERKCVRKASCPVWASWLTWGKCLGQCGSNGTRARRRDCVVKRYLQDEKNITNENEKVDVELCRGGYTLSIRERPCRVKQCQAYWLEWSEWSSCSSTCGTGYASSTRSCSRKNRKRCITGEGTRYKQCFSPPCWSSWSAYSPCTTSCGNEGIKTRTRQCKGTTATIPKYSSCSGNKTETALCNTHVCSRWGSWGQYSSCSKSCGVGTQFRRRSCEQGICEGSSIVETECNFQECPTWSGWSLYSCCSVSCGQGLKTRTRTCRHGNLEDCRGVSETSIACDVGPCNVTEVTREPFSCGRRVPLPQRAAKLRIFGGQMSKSQNWPWQVSLQYNSGSKQNPRWKHFCGGTLIHSQFVITAGHCSQKNRWKKYLKLDSPSDAWSVVFGTNNLNSVESSNRVGMKRIILHPNYESQRVIYNDIELIKLERPIQFSPSVMPACLPVDSVPTAGDICFVTGWGHTESSKKPTNRLKEGQIPILSTQQCRSLGYKYRIYLDQRSHICAGDPSTAITDSCEGDSGGPLTCYGPDQRWYVAGVTSFGFESCGTPNNAGIYAPLTAYQDWVRETIATYSFGGC